MATLAYIRSAITGSVVTRANCAVGGDKVPVNPDGIVLVKNGDSGSHTVTVVVPGNTKYGQADPDVAVAIAAGVEKQLGPFPQDLADPTDGLVHLTYDAITSMTIVALQVGG